MAKCIMTGCDLHDRSMLIWWAVGKGELKKRSFANTAQGRQKMIHMLKEEAKRLGAKRIVFAYEASCLGYGLYDELRAAGIECYVLAPTCMARSPKHTRTKTDEKDAERILDILRAHVLAGSPLPAVWVPDPQTREDRQIVRRRLELGEEVSRTKTRITDMLKLHGVRRPEGVQRWNEADRQWLQGLDGAHLGHGAQIVLNSLLRQLQFCEQEVRLQDQNVKVLAKDERYAGPAAELDALTGVGLLTAMVFLTEMGEMSRFANRRQVGAYLGLAPAAHESGEQSERKGHITKQGSSRVRKVLCQAAWALLGHDKGETAVHQRITRAQARRKKTATVALMRRLAVRMWHTAREAQRRCGCFDPAPATTTATTYCTARNGTNSFPGARL
jgi:transposase